MQKDGWSQRKIVCRWSESQTELCVKSQRDHYFIATKPPLQSTINMIEKSSTMQRIFKKGEMAMSDSSSPTNKSKAHLEAVYGGHAPRSQLRNWPASRQSRPRLYWSHLYRAHPWCRLDGHRSGLPMTITESMSTTNDCQLQNAPYRACGSTAQSSDSTSVLELGKYSHL